MQDATNPEFPLLLALLLIVVPLFAWMALQYRHAWRARRAGHRPEPMAWLRVIDPNHAALPTPTRQAPMMPAPSRWTLGRVTIYVAQAVAIGWLTWVMLGGAEPNGMAPDAARGVTVLGVAALILVAFATAVLTNLWGWAYRELEGLPFRIGRGVRAVARIVAPHRSTDDHARELNGAGRRVRRLSGETPERRRHLGIGE